MIGTEVGCDTQKLEFRFAPQSGSITFNVAQAITSSSSTETLQLKLLADGTTVNSLNIAFIQSAKLTIPLTGFSAIVLEVSDPECGGDGATVVLTASLNSK